MALRTIMLRKERDMKVKELEALNEKETELEKRAVELEVAVEEVTTEDERKEVEIQIKAYEDDKANLDAEKGELEDAIAEIDKELDSEEEKQEPTRTNEPEEEKRGEEITMETRDMNLIVQREDVQEFTAEIRNAIKEKRAITNAGQLIPEVVLPLIRETVEEESKLLPYTFYQRVAGTSRQPVMGAIPEAVWTEMCANLNELDLVFNILEMDGYKVGGFIPICNAVVEDNDIDLVTKVYEAIGTSIALALDKAILYGKGTKMPLGIATALASDVTDNVITGTGATGTALIQELILNSGNANSKYGKEAIWVMNHKTATTIKANVLQANSEGTVVGGIGDEMPVVGGRIVELNFVPDNNVFFGYFDDYALVERGQVRIEQSEHVQFIQDNLIIKGVGRFDGQPAIKDAFVLMSITTTDPTTEIEFAEDTANPVVSA